MFRKGGAGKKRDWNEAGIVSALESIGVTVYRLSGDGIPDLLTWSRGCWLPIEVKTARGKLTASQRRHLAGTPFPVVRSVPEALALFGVGPGSV